MKYLFAVLALLLLAACGQEPETDPAINIPADDLELAAPDPAAPINLAEQNACRANMQAASASVAMYMAQHGQPPATLGEALPAPVSCPDGGSYIYTVDGSDWTIECPSGESHGFMENGRPSW